MGLYWDKYWDKYWDSLRCFMAQMHSVPPNLIDAHRNSQDKSYVCNNPGSVVRA